MRVVALRFAMGAADVERASAYMVDERSGQPKVAKPGPILYSR
jgi:hypothetical protein